MKPHNSKNIPSPFQGEGKGEGEHPRNLALVPSARGLRQRQTDVEQKLWYYLRDRRMAGEKFRRQYPVGKYIVDFICVEQKLIIELDGGQHARNVTYDKTRGGWLNEQGYRILRFWNNELIENMEGVVEAIYTALSDPHPCPLPSREREKENS